MASRDDDGGGGQRNRRGRLLTLIIYSGLDREAASVTRRETRETVDINRDEVRDSRAIVKVIKEKK